MAGYTILQDGSEVIEYDLVSAYPKEKTMTDTDNQYRAHASCVTWYIYHRESGEFLDEVSSRTAYYAWLMSNATRYAYSECVVTMVKL